MALDVIREDELRKALAKWMLKNSRFCSCYKGGAADDFIETFRLPEADYELVSAHTEHNGEPAAVFRAFVRLADWQTCGGVEKIFEYYRIAKIIPNENGDFPELESMGYIITSE
jgi:hypothetical protein